MFQFNYFASNPSFFMMISHFRYKGNIKIILLKKHFDEMEQHNFLISPTVKQTKYLRVSHWIRSTPAFLSHFWAILFIADNLSFLHSTQILYPHIDCPWLCTVTNLRMIKWKWMFMSLIVISENDKPFKISQFLLWLIFIINSEKLQQNLVSSGFHNFLWLIFGLVGWN